MPKVIYEVTLFPDGKHSVSVRSDDPSSFKDALPLAKKIQDWVSGVDHSQSPPSKPQPAQPQDLQESQTPLCGVHATPMDSVQGKHGLFWSCHQRNLDGSWCRFRPGRTPANTTPPSYRFPTA